MTSCATIIQKVWCVLRDFSSATRTSLKYSRLVKGKGDTVWIWLHMVKRCWSLKLPEQRLKHWSFAVYIVDYTTQLRADLWSHYKDPYKPKCHVRVLLQFILRIVYRELRNRMRGDTVTAIQEAFESGWPKGVCPNGAVGRGVYILVVEFSNGERDIESAENGLEMVWRWYF